MILYHAVRTFPASEEDFLSAAAKGRQLRGKVTEQLLEISRGISGFSTLKAMRENMERFPEHGTIIAVLDIPDDGSIRRERTTKKPDHWTIWGSPSVLLLLISAYLE